MFIHLPPPTGFQIQSHHGPPPSCGRVPFTAPSAPLHPAVPSRLALHEEPRGIHSAALLLQLSPQHVTGAEARTQRGPEPGPTRRSGRHNDLMAEVWRWGNEGERDTDEGGEVLNS